MSTLPVVFLVLYVGLDLSSPLWPGALNFDPDDSVDGLHSDQGRQALALPASEPTAERHPAAVRLLPHVKRPPRIAAAPGRSRHVPRSQLATPPDPALSGDDH